MPLLISDSNILIDFEEGGLVDELFRLADTIGVPDILFEEELRKRHEHLLDLGLDLMELRAEAVQRTVNLASRCSTRRTEAPDGLLQVGAPAVGVRVRSVLLEAGEVLGQTIQVEHRGDANAWATVLPEEPPDVVLPLRPAASATTVTRRGLHDDGEEVHP